jgi:hypothetical protein
VARAEHVVLVSIDGMRPEFYLDERWPLPLVQAMAREGAHARGVRSVFPAVTYPAHTTLITGALPGRHGVYYNTPFDPAGQTGAWDWNFSSIRVPTLWDAVRAKGGTTASVGWPVTVGAPIDWNVPDIWNLDRSADALIPVREHTTPPGLFGEIEREATGRLDERTFTSASLARDTRAGEIAAYLLKKYRPTLLTVHFIEVDHMEHHHGRDDLMVHRALATVDAALGEIRDVAEMSGLLETTAFVITGDHGFFDVTTGIHPNAWLVRAGLMEAKPDRGDWRGAFLTSGGVAMLHLRDPRDDQAVALARAAMESVPHHERWFRIMEADELRRRGAHPDARLGLAAVPGVMFREDPAPPLEARHGGEHGFLPEYAAMRTGFVGSAPYFRGGAVAEEMGVEDVAPVVAALLGLDFQAPDGVLLPGLLAQIPSTAGHE